VKIASAKLVPALAVSAILAAVVWHFATRVSLAHVMVGDDSSISVEKKCADLRNALQSFLVNKPGIRDGSTLAFLVIGADFRNPDPSLRFSEVIPVRSDSVYGQDEQKFHQAENQFFDKVEGICEAAEVRRSSPIYELVRQGIAHLRSVGCGPGGPCYYLIKTDLDEDIQPELRAAIERAAKNPSAEVSPELSGSIDNRAVVIHVCGTSEATPRRETGRAPASPDARIRIWRQLFTHPELVSFSPFCSK